MEQIYRRFQTAYETALTTEQVSLPIIYKDQELVFIYRGKCIAGKNYIEDITRVYAKAIRSEISTETSIAHFIPERTLFQIVATPFSMPFTSDEAAKQIDKYYEEYERLVNASSTSLPDICVSIIESVFDGGLLLAYQSLICE